MRFINALVASAVIAITSSSVLAQSTAVQWTTASGGNGHWYLRWTDPVQTDWSAIGQLAASKGAQLLTVSSAAEQTFFFDLFGSAVIGLSAAPGSSEFVWATGEEVSFSNWGTSQCGFGPYPNNPNTNRRFVIMNFGPCVGSHGIRPAWDDYELSELGPTIIGIGLEWSADCNADGIVDYGQILSGQLIDANSNGIPDCCENGTACESQSSAVQWTVASGGNGHWYQFRRLPLNHCWTQARNMCEADGGHLATITSAPENNLLRSLTIKNDPGVLEGGPYIGGTCVGLPWGQFYWITGEPFVYTNWLYGAPNGSQGETEQYLQFWRWSDLGWNDQVLCGGLMFSHLIEWEADCNSDGIVDYGQILSGQLIDANSNGIPDSCEVDPCPGDISGNGAVDGVDLSVLLGVWGTDGSGGEFDADVTNDGIVNGADLTIILGGWGPCPN